MFTCKVVVYRHPAVERDAHNCDCFTINGNVQCIVENASAKGIWELCHLFQSYIDLKPLTQWLAGNYFQRLGINVQLMGARQTVVQCMQGSEAVFKVSLETSRETEKLIGTCRRSECNSLVSGTYLQAPRGCSQQLVIVKLQFNTLVDCPSLTQPVQLLFLAFATITGCL